MTKEDFERVLDEAIRLVKSGETEDCKVGMLESGKQVDPLVWFTVYAIVCGIGICALMQLEQKERQRQS